MRVWEGRKRGAASQQHHSRTSAGRQPHRLSPFPVPSSYWAGSRHRFFPYPHAVLQCPAHRGFSTTASSSSAPAHTPRARIPPARARSRRHRWPSLPASPPVSLFFLHSLNFHGLLSCFCYVVIKPVRKFWPRFRAAPLELEILTSWVRNLPGAPEVTDGGQ